MRFHGMDREAWDRFGKTGSPHYQITAPGFKYNMMDIQAALGIHQLPQLDDFIEKTHASCQALPRKIKRFYLFTIATNAQISI